ncbi:MAG: hypothetical protein V4751_04330 [Pseudomonadota bacterium]
MNRLLVFCLLIAGLTTAALADSAVNSIRVSSRLDLNSTIISGVDVVFFYDTSIVQSQLLTHFEWYSNKRNYRATHAEVIDIVNLPVLQGFGGATLTLPERHQSALKVLVFSEHQSSTSPAFDITSMQNVLIEIDQFGLIVSAQ